MDFNFDSIATHAVAMAVSLGQDQIDKAVDDAATKIVAAVKNTDSKIDDTVALAVAAALERLAAGVKAGVGAP